MAVLRVPRIFADDLAHDEDDLVNFPRVLAVDPGVVTGWAVVWFDADRVFDRSKSITSAVVAWHCGMWVGREDQHVDAMIRKIRTHNVGGEGCAVVLEDFIPQELFKDRAFLSPVRLAAMMRYVLRLGIRIPVDALDESDGFESGGEVEVMRRDLWNPKLQGMQMASPAKSSFSDARLRQRLMYLPGKDHPRDATRHALLWMSKLRQNGEELYDLAHYNVE